MYTSVNIVYRQKDQPTYVHISDHCGQCCILFIQQTDYFAKEERDDQMCCNDVVDYIEHFFFDCPTIKKFWNYAEQYILTTFYIWTHSAVVDLLKFKNQLRLGFVSM